MRTVGVPKKNHCSICYWLLLIVGWLLLILTLECKFNCSIGLFLECVPEKNWAKCPAVKWTLGLFKVIPVKKAFSHFIYLPFWFDLL